MGSVPVVQEFRVVFSEELSGVLSERKVEFRIDSECTIKVGTT